MSLLRTHQLASTRERQAVFQPVDLCVEAGQAVEVLGDNGAGKSTLLRTLAGLHSQFDGELNVSPMLYQGHRLALDELLSAADNLSWYADIGGMHAPISVLRECLAQVGMLSYALTPVGRLSQGQQRRVSMARWLLSDNCSDTPVWLLDEPVTALDVSAQTLLVSVLEAHCQAGGVVLYATHTPLPLAAKQTLRIVAQGDATPAQSEDGEGRYV